jgi:hypothetical protein
MHNKSLMLLTALTAVTFVDLIGAMVFMKMALIVHCGSVKILELHYNA